MDTQSELIYGYFNEGLKYMYVDILTIMPDTHGIAIGLRHLHRILRKVNLRRPVYSDLPEIIDFVLGELETPGRSHGYRMMQQKCAANGLHVRTQDVADILRMRDPIGNMKVLKVLTDLRIGNEWPWKI